MVVPSPLLPTEDTYGIWLEFLETPTSGVHDIHKPKLQKEGRVISPCRGSSGRGQGVPVQGTAIQTVTSPNGVLSSDGRAVHPSTQAHHLSCTWAIGSTESCQEQSVWRIPLEKAHQLGFLVNWVKSGLVQTSPISLESPVVFLVEAYDLVVGLVRSPEPCRVLRRQPLKTAWFLLRLLGALNSVTDIIPYR